MSKCVFPNERGAILVHVGVALLGLLLFNAFVFDYGVMWVARRQAQNAADAGALSGAIARIYDDSSASPSTTSGKVYSSIVNTVADNFIWGQAPPAAAVEIGWNCPDGTTDCARVDVYRDATHGTALPTFFLPLANVQSQKVRAHAIAQMVPANETGCMRPWFLLDKYNDANKNGKWDPGELIQGYVTDPPPGDLGKPYTFHNNSSPSGYGQIDVGNGGAAIREAIEHCASGDYWITESVPTKPGGTVGPERQGVDALMDWDPGARWDGERIAGSCADTDSCTCDGNCPYDGKMSPRIAIVPVCSPAEASCVAGGPSNSTITITNFLSFLIMGHSGNGNNMNIEAILVGAGGTVRKDAGSPPANAAFLKTVVLVL